MILLLPLLAAALSVTSDARGRDNGLDLAPYGAANLTGVMVDSRITESSGLAVSMIETGRFWTHNDGGNEPLIFAIGSDGSRQGYVRLAAVENLDWEDLTAFMLDGQSYLGIADVGDNGAVRKTLSILLIKEPENPRGQSVKPDRVLSFRLEGGPRDIESAAFDVNDRAFYLLAKRGYPPYLYRLPWPDEDAHGLQTATRVGTVAAIPQPKPIDQKTDPKGWRYRSQPTAMDFSSDGRRAVVLTYRHAYLFQRRDQESWAAAMARAPQLIKLPALPQSEGIAFDPEGRILISTEKWPAPLLMIQPTQ